MIYDIWYDAIWYDIILYDDMICDMLCTLYTPRCQIVHVVNDRNEYKLNMLYKIYKVKIKSYPGF